MTATTMTTTMTTTPENLLDELYNEFKDDIKEDNSLPFCQFINPATARDPNFGLAISKENAEKAKFRQDCRWELKPFDGWEKSEEIYLTKNPRFVILSRSAREVEEKTSKGWKTLGLAYSGGAETEHFAKTKISSDFRVVTRLLVIFVDECNEALHEKPFKLTARVVGGFKTLTLASLIHDNMGSAFKNFCLSKGNASVQNTLTKEGKAFVVIDLNYSVLTPKDRNKKPSICVSKACIPGFCFDSPIGEFDDNGLKVELNIVNFPELMVRKTSLTGKKIAELLETYKSFEDLPVGQSQDNTIPEPAGLTFPVEGFVKLNPVNDEPFASGTFVSLDGDEYQCSIELEYGALSIPTGEDYHILVRTGKIKDSVLTIESWEKFEVDEDIPF